MLTFAILYLSECTKVHLETVHIFAQSDENDVAEAVVAIVKFKSVSNHECQSYRFFRGSDFYV